jgi:hypothetical protein
MSDIGIYRQLAPTIYLRAMRITPEFDDAPDFIGEVERVANGVIRRHAPETLVLIKIDNWFGSKWLGFSGKALGAIGVWSKPYNRPADNITIPPFVPNRVVSQRRFAAPAYEEIDGGKPIDKSIPSDLALVRKAALAEPMTALVWYSGNSQAAGRGAVMVYAPVGDSYWPWYAALETGEPWRVTETWDIKREDLSGLMDEGSVTIQT